MIYLDYNATTPVDPEVFGAMRPYLAAKFGNPSSGHALGREAAAAMSAARTSLARLIGSRAEEVLFTGGGTEASNLAIKGLAWARSTSSGHLITTAVEHPATMEPIRFLQQRGCSCTVVGVDSTGLVDPDDVRRALRKDTFLISVMHAQNEVGTIEPIEELGRIAREAGVYFHVDAAQSVGKIPVNVQAMNADLVSIAGHKMYAPKGIGALYIRQGVALEPLIHGASQEGGRRGGTENVSMAVGLGKAAELAAAHLTDPCIRDLRDHFWAGLSGMLGDRVTLNGHPTLRLPGTLHVSFIGRVGGEVLAKLGEIHASTGAACHAGDAKPSAVLMAMGLSRDRATGAVRFSIGRPTTRAEIDRTLALLGQKMC